MTTTSAVPRHEMRDHYVKKISELLHTRGTVTRDSICQAFDLNPNTCSAYLHHMYKDLRVIRKGEKHFEWVSGEDLTLPDDDADEKWQRTVPARQMGMARDALVAALFGVAPGVAA